VSVRCCSPVRQAASRQEGPAVPVHARGQVYRLVRSRGRAARPAKGPARFLENSTGFRVKGPWVQEEAGTSAADPTLPAAGKTGFKTPGNSRAGGTGLSAGRCRFGRPHSRISNFSQTHGEQTTGVYVAAGPRDSDHPCPKNTSAIPGGVRAAMQQVLPVGLPDLDLP
jgi:hypothetical protein